MPGKHEAKEWARAHVKGLFTSPTIPFTDDLKLDATALNGTNQMELRVFANEAHGHAVLMARLDNLGKGASGAAVQNILLMLQQR